jgi:hypothetical protein
VRGRFRGLLSNPKFAAARTACASDLPKGARSGALRGAFAGGRFAAAFAKYRTKYEAAVKSYAACVTAHGFAMPAPNFTRGPGESVFPKSIETNAKFVEASRSCTLRLPPRPAFGPGPAPPAGTSTAGTAAPA